MFQRLAGRNIVGQASHRNKVAYAELENGLDVELAGDLYQNQRLADEVFHLNTLANLA